VTSQKPKILIGVPAFNGLQPECQQSFMGMVYHCGKDLGAVYDVAVAIITKKEQFRARNHIVDAAIAGDFTWLLMLDDDMVVPDDLVSRLLAHQKDVCGALYYQRGGSYHPVILAREILQDGNWVSRFLRQDHPIIRDPGLHMVDIIGGGCMLFKVDVFRKLVPPYFWWEHSMGTDIAICNRLVDAGIDIWCDTSIELGHLQSDRQVVTSRTIPSALQAASEVNEVLWQDAVAFLGMEDAALESFMIQASVREHRAEKWHASVQRTAWEDVKQYYIDHGDWHIANLLYFNMTRRDPVKEWVFMHAHEHVPPGGTVIDYGLGLGHVAFALADKGVSVLGVEIAGAATLPFVRWRFAHHALAGSLRILETTEATPGEPCPVQVDGACCISVLDHLVDPWGVLAWLSCAVKPGGWMILDYQSEKSEHEPQHLRNYDPATFEENLRGLGWEVSPECPWLFLRRKEDRYGLGTERESSDPYSDTGRGDVSFAYDVSVGGAIGDSVCLDHAPDGA